MSGFSDQVATDWDGIAEGLYSEGKVFSQQVTYDPAVGSDSTITVFPEEQVGALDDKQNKLFRFATSELTNRPERGDRIYQTVSTPGGDVIDQWWVVDVRVDDLGFYELRCIKAEDYS